MHRLAPSSRSHSLPNARTSHRRLGAVGRHLLLGAGVASLAGLGAAVATAQQTPGQPTGSQAATAAPVTGVGQNEQQDAQLAMALRLETAAYQVVQHETRGKNAQAGREAAAFLEAAERLNPNEARYPRLRADAMNQLGDVSGAIAALEKYVAIKKNDDVARLRLIEYYVAKMQTTDAKLGYLQSLLEKDTVSNAIKSRAAVWAAVLLGERSLAAQDGMVRRAVELDPYNVYARRMEYDMIASGGGSPEERVKSLVNQLRCNPGQIPVLAAIGRELAAAGILRPSLDWFAAAANLATNAQQPVDAGFLIEYASQLYLNGMPQMADDVTARVLTADVTNLDGWFMRLTLRKSAGLQVAFERDMDKAKEVFASRAGELAKRIAATDSAVAAPSTQPTGGTEAASGTQPATQAFDFNAAFSAGGQSAAPAGAGPNAAPQQVAAPTGQGLASTIERLKQPTADPYYKSEFISALIDLAWFEVYYNRSAPAAQVWVDAVTALLPDDKVTVPRLRGWLELLNNRQAEAMKLLWPIRETDPQAGMGVVQLLAARNWAPAGAAGQPATKPASFDPNVLSQKLLNAYPSGLTAAMLLAEFKDRKLAPQPAEWAQGVKSAVDAFPIDFIRIVDQAERFYVPKGEAQKLPYRLGEPMVVDVSITNLSDFAIPIGPDGVIKPDLWFDARVSAGRENLFPMSGFDRIAGALTLPPRGTITQSVRVDQGGLAEALWQRPGGSVDVYMTVMTNPMLQPNYKVVAGPGGVRRMFARSLIRGGMPILTEEHRKKLREGLVGLPNEKMWTIDVMAALVMQSRGSDQEPNVKHHAPDFQASIAQLENDRVPHVAAWASYMLLRLAEPSADGPGDPAVVEQQVKRLSASPLWEGKMLAVWGTLRLPPERREVLLVPLANDSHDLVKRAATAELVLAKQGVSALPTTKPTATPDQTVPTGPAIPEGGGSPSLPLPGE